MKIRQKEQVPQVNAAFEGASGVTQQILIGPQDGSENIIMRYFKIIPDGYTPRHKHPHEHVVKIEKGRGIVIDGNGKENEVSTGHSIFIESNEEHHFKNPFSEPFEFICVILNPEKSTAHIYDCKV